MVPVVVFAQGGEFDLPLCVGGRLKSPLYLQSDNASDNKNYTMLFLCGWLVTQGVVDEVELAMLLVGHTHEDIDQMFSIPSRYFYVLPAGVVRDIKEFFHHVKSSFTPQQQLQVCLCLSHPPLSCTCHVPADQVHPRSP
jgi:hypothetical protein